MCSLVQAAVLSSVLVGAVHGPSPQAPPATPDEKLKQKWEQAFRAADKDHSRSLNREEAKAGLPKVLFRHFDEIDLDASGAITPEELWAMHEREVAARERRRGEPTDRNGR